MPPQEDDVLPNESSYFVPREPKEQAISRKKEQAETLEKVNEIEEFIKRLDERIDERDRISTIGVDITEDPELHQKRCIVNAMIAKELRKERKYFKGLLDIHTRQT